MWRLVNVTIILLVIDRRWFVQACGVETWSRSVRAVLYRLCLWMWRSAVDNRILLISLRPTTVQFFISIQSPARDDW